MFAHTGERLLAAVVLSIAALLVITAPQAVSAQPDRLPHRLSQPTPQPVFHHPVPAPHNPGHTPHHPGHVPTPGPACPGVPVSCPQPAPCLGMAKVWKLFYAYPGRSNTVRSLGNFSLDPRSSGLDPLHDGGSATITDDSGAIILEMPGLQFDAAGASFMASNDQGSVSVWPFAGQYSFEIKFDSPAFAKGFFPSRLHLCLNVGDDGFQESVVCQKKPFGGFVCHE